MPQQTGLPEPLVALCPYCFHDLVHDIDTDLDTCPNCGSQFPVHRALRRLETNWQERRDAYTLVAEALCDLAAELPGSRDLLQQAYQWATEAAEEADTMLRGNDEG